MRSSDEGVKLLKAHLLAVKSLIEQRRARGGGVSVELHLKKGDEKHRVWSNPVVRSFFDKTEFYYRKAQ